MRRYTLLIFIFTLFFALFLINTQKDIPSFSSKKEGYISNIKNYEQSYMIYVDNLVYSGYGSSQGYSLGDYVAIEGEFRSVLNLENKGFGRYLRSKGKKYIVTKGSISTINIPRFNIYTLPAFTTNKIEKILNSLYASKSPLPKALLMGFSLEEEILDSFREVGTAHVLALSGFHVGFIFIFLSCILFFIPLNFRWVLISIFLILYSYITGMKPSIIRASSFFIIFFFCFKKAYRFDTLSVLLAIASVMIALNPYAIFDAGFCLSFLCVASITMFTPILIQLRKKLFPKLEEKFLLYISNVIFVTISAQLLSSPYSISTFGNFPVFSIFANLLTLPLVGILMAVVLLSLCFSFIMPLARLLASLGGIIIDIILNINQQISEISFANISINLTPLSAILITILIASLYLCYEYYQIRENVNEL